jgi:hypothetical protein
MSTVTTAPLIAEPEFGELHCPNGHNSAIPPKCPVLMFVACRHYSTEATWNEFCIVCGGRHEPLAIYWRSYRMGGRQGQNPKNYCGFCGAKMVAVGAPR